jgi:hypothetical protein
MYLGGMAAEPDEEVSGLDLLRQPATAALARYLNDLHSILGFEAYLWRMIVKVDYGHGDPAKFPKPGDPPPPESAVAQMDVHAAVLDEMVFCKGVNSFLTYLADLMTLIYEKYPTKLPSNKQTTYRFCIEHHLAGDLTTTNCFQRTSGNACRLRTRRRSRLEPKRSSSPPRFPIFVEF